MNMKFRFIILALLLLVPRAASAQDKPQMIPLRNTDAVRGSDDALVTIIQYGDFGCPYTQRSAKTMNQVLTDYPKEVRVVYRHFPLPFHKTADEAAEAAIAAGEQGKFWEFHDHYFEIGAMQVSKSDVGALQQDVARAFKLDMKKFNASLDSGNPKKMVERDISEGKSYGVRGTPAFFINGIYLSGAQPHVKFKEIIDDQLKVARKLKKKHNLKGDWLYAKVVEENRKNPPAGGSRPSIKKAQESVVAPVGSIKTGKSPTLGSKNAAVQVVVFSDLQCPFCKRFVPTMEAIHKKYGNKIQIVFKHNPLPFHREAEPAARATWAAHQQGKFWKMHDLLFGAQKSFKEANMDTLMEMYAEQLNLNMKKFRKDYDSKAAKDAIRNDQDLAVNVGARGTPNTFINGIKVTGARAETEFTTLIDEQLALAKKLGKKKRKKGSALRDLVWAENVKNADKYAKPTNAARPKPAEVVDVKKLKKGKSFAKGSSKAKVTIVAFSDLQCPFCQRAWITVNAVQKKYGDKKVRIVYKAFPLPFHKQAEEAHRAAIAAGKQGKFFDMVDLIHGRYRELRENPKFAELFAEELGLNMKKFKKDLNSKETAKQVQEEKKQGEAVGVRGTPAFFINGKRLVGAQPQQKFESMIDEEL